MFYNNSIKIERLYDEVVEPIFNTTVTAIENDEEIDEHRIVLPSKYDATNFPVLLSDYFTYLENYYIGAANRSGKRRKPAYSPELWSKYNAVLAGRYRTSNSAENWHRQVQSSLNKMGSVWKFIDWISQVKLINVTWTLKHLLITIYFKYRRDLFLDKI